MSTQAFEGGRRGKRLECSAAAMSRISTNGKRNIAALTISIFLQFLICVKIFWVPLRSNITLPRAVTSSCLHVVGSPLPKATLQKPVAGVFSQTTLQTAESNGHQACMESGKSWKIILYTSDGIQPNSDGLIYVYTNTHTPSTMGQ